MVHSSKCSFLEYSDCKLGMENSSVLHIFSHVTFLKSGYVLKSWQCFVVVAYKIMYIIVDVVLELMKYLSSSVSSTTFIPPESKISRDAERGRKGAWR